jgi:hypothetical protein
MTKLRLVFVFSCLILFAVATSPVFANGVKADLGASGRGVANPDCAGTILVNPACFEFSTTSATTATWEAFSLTDFNTATFSTIGPYDLFLVTGITSGTQVTLTLTGASDVFGSFLCGDDPTMTTQLGGFCADPTNALGGDPSSIFSQNPSATDASGQATFIFNASAPTTWVFYATKGDATISVNGGGTTTAAEPGTLLLLAAGAGLLAIAKLRRS